MINWPDAPTPGQVFNSGTGPIYIWDGVAWNLATSQTRTARSHNLLLNPSMQVSQENGTAVGNTHGYYPVDQWITAMVGMICSFQQVASLTPDLSPNRIRKTVTTLKASLAAGDVSYMGQRVEGSRIACLGHGTANAIQSVLRFGCRGPAGTYSFSLRNGAADRTYLKNFTISAAQANIDTLQVFTIPGDTTGTWVTDNTLGATFIIVDAVGASYLGTDGIWQAGNFFGTAANSNMVATNGNVVELFDTGWYPDPEKTGLPPPFIAPEYVDDLLRCQRYFERQNQVLFVTTANINQRSWAVPKRVVPVVQFVPNSGSNGAVTATDVNGWYQTTAHSAAVQGVVQGNARM